MTYYRKKEDVDAGKDKSAGKIDLEQATAVEVTQSSSYFEIATPTRVWKLQADSTPEAVSWARDILGQSGMGITRRSTVVRVRSNPFNSFLKLLFLHFPHPFFFVVPHSSLPKADAGADGVSLTVADGLHPLRPLAYGVRSQQEGAAAAARRGRRKRRHDEQEGRGGAVFRTRRGGAGGEQQRCGWRAT